MQHYVKWFLTLGVLLLSLRLSAQEVYRSNEPAVLARFSYDNSAQEKVDHRICMAVSRAGDFRMLRLTNEGKKMGFQGRIPEEQFKQLQGLLTAPDFRSLSGDHGGLIRRESESFTAEIPHGENAGQRVQWLNADGENPFPGSVAKVVDWLKHFQPKDATTLQDVEYRDVCPSGGLRFVQPTVAANGHP
jgi:hypothetical protein